MSTKQTPKSLICHCHFCRSGRHTNYGKFIRHYIEKKFRHDAKIALNHGAEDVCVAPTGNYSTRY